MSEWWTYSLSSFLLFSPQTYYRLLELHNAALWPAHLAALALGSLVMALLLARGRGAAALAGLLLGACWLWVGWSFLHARYATINWAVVYVVPFFALQGLALAAAGCTGGLRPVPRGHPRALAGIALGAYALVLHPVAGPLLGREWAAAEVFAITPDPTAIGTLGILVLSASRWRFALMAVPILWCLAGGATLAAMSAPDAVLPLAAAVLATVSAMVPERRIR